MKTTGDLHPQDHADFRHLTGLDILRLLLCGAVVWQHFVDPRPSSGPLAVIGFFVLSGFLSGYTLQNKPFDAMKFFEGKTRRLLPTLVSTTLLALVLLTFDPAFPSPIHALGHVRARLVAGQFSLFSIIDVINLPAWYMYVEIVCVVLLPCILFARRTKWGFQLLFTLFLGAAALRYSQIPWSAPFGNGFYYELGCHLWQFLAGMACSFLAGRTWPRWLRITIPALFLIMLAASMILLQEKDLNYLNYTLPFDITVTCLFVLLIPLLANRRFSYVKKSGAIVSHASIAWAASLTYGIYLLHVPVFRFLEHLHPDTWLFPGETACLALAATVLLAIANRRWWENRWIRPSTGSASTC